MHLKPRTAQEVADIVRDALDVRRTLEVRGHGSRSIPGRPIVTDAVLDISELSGVTLYEPAELVLTAHSATPMREISEFLAAQGQHLAFEPPDLGLLWGLPAGAGTIGGCLAVGLGGSRRLAAGAPRDHFLGFHAVNGFGEPFAAGGRVVKNVTGYDLPKLMAGSFGTLGVLTQVTVKVMPAPETSSSLLLLGLNDDQALAAMAVALTSPAQVSGAAHLPAPLASRSTVPEVAAEGTSVTVLRLEGIVPSVTERAARLRDLLAQNIGEIERIDASSSIELWREISDVRLLAGNAARPVWRLSVPPSRGAAVMRRLLSEADASYFYDWAGGEIWVELAGDGKAGESLVRNALRTESESGHATLMRGSPDLRAQVPVFQPPGEPMAALIRRVKERFDPAGLLNPGRMYPW